MTSETSNFRPVDSPGQNAVLDGKNTTASTQAEAASAAVTKKPKKKEEESSIPLPVKENSSPAEHRPPVDFANVIISALRNLGTWLNGLVCMITGDGVRGRMLLNSMRGADTTPPPSANPKNTAPAQTTRNQVTHRGTTPTATTPTTNSTNSATSDHLAPTNPNTRGSLSGTFWNKAITPKEISAMSSSDQFHLQQRYNRDPKFAARIDARISEVVDIFEEASCDKMNEATLWELQAMMAIAGTNDFDNIDGQRGGKTNTAFAEYQRKHVPAPNISCAEDFDSSKALVWKNGEWKKFAESGYCGRGTKIVLDKMGYPTKGANGADWDRNLMLDSRYTFLPGITPKDAFEGVILCYDSDDERGKPRTRNSSGRETGGSKYGHIEAVAAHNGQKYFVSDKPRLNAGGTVPHNFAGAFVYDPHGTVRAEINAAKTERYTNFAQTLGDDYKSNLVANAKPAEPTDTKEMKTAAAPTIPALHGAG